MTIWKPGMKAVCIDDEWQNQIHGKITSNPLNRDGIYVVTRVSTGCGVYKGELNPVVLYFNDVQNTVHPFDTGFAAARFRPAVERKTDISSLEALLQNPHVEIPETV